MNPTDLKKVYTPVPNDFHDALFAVTHSVEEEPKMKKTMRLVLVVLLVLALLCGTAVAYNSFYSVRDYKQGAQDADSELSKHIVELHQKFENDLMELTFNDALFDGLSFDIAMTMYAKDEKTPFLFSPHIYASCGDETLYPDIEGMSLNFHSGCIFPNITSGDYFQGNHSVSGCLVEGFKVDAPVTWTVEIQIAKPNWPVVDIASLEPNYLNMRTEEEYRKPFVSAYENKQIAVISGEEIVEFAAYMPKPEDITQEEYDALSYCEQLMLSDAFTLVDTITYTFTTPVPTSTILHMNMPEVIERENYTILVRSINVTFAQLLYEYTVVPKTPMTEDELKASPLIPNSFLWQGGSSAAGYNCETRDDGSAQLFVYGGYTLPGNIPEELTITPAHLAWGNAGESDHHLKDDAFVITITQD